MPPRRVRDQEILKKFADIESAFKKVESFLLFCMEMSEADYNKMNCLWFDFTWEHYREDPEPWKALPFIQHICIYARTTAGYQDVEKSRLSASRKLFEDVRKVLERKLISLKSKEEALQRLTDTLRFDGYLKEDEDLLSATEAQGIIDSLSSSSKRFVEYSYYDAKLLSGTSPCFEEPPCLKYLEKIQNVFGPDPKAMGMDGHLGFCVQYKPKCSIAWQILRQISAARLIFVREEKHSSMTPGFIACSEKLLEIDPCNYGVWYQLGLCLHRMQSGSATISGKSYNFADCFVEVLKFDPKSPKVWNLLATYDVKFTLDGCIFNQGACALKVLELAPNHWLPYSIVWKILPSPIMAPITTNGFTFHSSYDLLLKCYEVASNDSETLMRFWIMCAQLLIDQGKRRPVFPLLAPSTTSTTYSHWRASEMVLRGEAEGEKPSIFLEGRKWTANDCIEHAIDITPPEISQPAWELLLYINHDACFSNGKQLTRRQCCDAMMRLTSSPAGCTTTDTMPWLLLATTVAFGELVRDVDGKDYSVPECIEKALLEVSPNKVSSVWIRLYIMNIIPPNEMMMINGKLFSRSDALLHALSSAPSLFCTDKITDLFGYLLVEENVCEERNKADISGYRICNLRLLLECDSSFRGWDNLASMMRSTDVVDFHGTSYTKTMVVTKSLELYHHPKNPSWLKMYDILEGEDNAVVEVEGKTYTLQDCADRAVWCAMVDASMLGLIPPPPDFETSRRQYYDSIKEERETEKKDADDVEVVPVTLQCSQVEATTTVGSVQTASTTTVGSVQTASTTTVGSVQTASTTVLSTLRAIEIGLSVLSWLRGGGGEL